MDDKLYSPDYLTNHIEDPIKKLHTAKLIENAQKWMEEIKAGEEPKKKTKTDRIMEFFKQPEEIEYSPPNKNGRSYPTNTAFADFMNTPEKYQIKILDDNWSSVSYAGCKPLKSNEMLKKYE